MACTPKPIRKARRRFTKNLDKSTTIIIDYTSDTISFTELKLEEFYNETERELIKQFCYGDFNEEIGLSSSKKD